MYCARSGDSSTRFKAHIETVYLDPNDEFLTQAVGQYLLLGSDSLFGSEQIHTVSPQPLDVPMFF